MSQHQRARWPVFLGALLFMGAAAQALSAVAGHADEAPFIAANDAAMSTMMTGMAVKPTGDVDVDFTAMMIPHHQGAIDMAEAELRFGQNEKLRRIAQEIIVDQQSEIAAMRLALGRHPAPDSTPAGSVTATSPPRAQSAPQPPALTSLEIVR